MIDERDQRAATCYVDVADVEHIDALCVLYGRDRREVLGALVKLGLNTLAQRSMMLTMPAPPEAAVLLPDVPRLAVRVRRVP